MRWTRQRFARKGIAGQVERFVSDQQHADERRLQRTAKSCGPDAPTLASSSRMASRSYRAQTSHTSADDGGKKARSPGRARRKPLKPLRAGMPGDSGVLVVTRVRSTTTKCTRGRGCSGHPAFPTPSRGREINAQLGRFAPRDREVVSGIRAPSLRAKRSNPFFLYVARWIASRSLSSGAHSRDPVARIHWSGRHCCPSFQSEAGYSELWGCADRCKGV